MMLYQLGDALLRNSIRIPLGREPVPSCKQVGPMLRGMRKASSNWLGKTIMAVVMGVLIISFGVWGIADIFRGFGQSTLAKVGRTEISTEQFRQLYTDKLQQIGRQFGRPLTMEQARAFGLDRQVLQQTIAEAALDEEARRLGLGQSDAETMRMIFSDPNFKGVDGKFDPARFQATIRQFGYHRTALHRRPAEGVAAAPDRRHDLRRPRTAEGDDRGAQPLPERTALDRIRQARRRPGRHHRSAVAGNAGRLFRRAQGPVPRARISQDRLCRDHAGRDRQMDRSLRRGRQEAVRAAPRQARNAGKARSVADRVPERGRSHGGAQPHRLRNVVRRSRQGARAQVRPTSISAWSRNPRSSIPRSRTRPFRCPPARSASRCRAASALPWSRSARSSPASQPSYESVAANLKKEIATERARKTVSDLRDKMEDERGGGASVDRGRAETGAHRRHHRRRRSLRPPAQRPAGDQHSPRPRCRLAGLHQRCRRRQRSDLVQRRLCLVRRARHHAVARTQPRRGQGSGRGAMARRPDRQPAAHQGDRNGAKARSGRQARRRGGKLRD